MSSYDELMGSPMDVANHPDNSQDYMGVANAKQDVDNMFAAPPKRDDQFHDGGVNIPGKLKSSNDAYMNKYRK